ncbi:Putative ribonuclease H protein At1g65750 [Linum perenne]
MEEDDPKCPTIRIPNEEKARVRRRFSHALIVNTLDRCFPFSFMSRKLPQLWAKKGSIVVSDVGFGFYIVRFETVADYERALFGGPWMINDHYVVIQEWRPYFRPEDTILTTLRVWVRLPGLPLEYFDHSILKIIGDRIGRTVRIDLLGIAATQDLGRYLGVPILHGRVTKATYEYILHRMDEKLAGWKAHNLSLAGRVTLASSVLNAIPSYAMQTAFLPVSICDSIDRKIRNFIWGSTEGARKIHNINWGTVCKPKGMGGLGLRNARDLNKAFLMKLVWGLLKNPSDLWAKVLIAKYLKKTPEGFVLARKTGFSAIWRGILKVWQNVVNGLQRSIGDGRGTRFWTDRWVDGGDVLIDHALNIQGVNASICVDEACSVNGEWNSDFIFSVLPRDIALQVIGMTPPRNNIGQDSFIWGLEPNGKFSISSAYQLLTVLSPDSRDPTWVGVWRWPGPNRIKHFLWLATHKRLLTNEERSRRHLTNQVVCPRCSLRTESISHVLLECQFALQVWDKTLPLALTERRRHNSFDSWWCDMLKNTSSNVKFGVTAWLIWKARNKFIFEDLRQSHSAVAEQCEFWTNLVLSSWKTNQLGREAPGLARQTQLIAWRPGDGGWCTLNTDGSRIGSTGATSIGGLIRNEKGEFVRAFCGNIGDCSITRAELRAIVEGLKLAWSLGLRRIVVQTDSRAAVTILQRGVGMQHQHEALVADFVDLSSRDWEVQLTHVYREANCAADHLANLGHSFDIGMYLFDFPDVSLAHWLRYDLIGVALPRVISIN